MPLDQGLVFLLIFSMLLMFIWGKYRYDLVALSALLISVMIGVVSTEDAFSGFSHPAVMTVIAVLIVSKGLMNSGLVDFLAIQMNKVDTKPWVQLSILILAVIFASSFMNNVGALALMMPVAIKMAKKNKQSPSLFLMPLAFGSLLGGMITLVGTPPNIIISSFRAQNVSVPFSMFDFAPVGLAVSFVGALFLLLFSSKLLPKRNASSSNDSAVEIKEYITELKVIKTSSCIGKTLKEFEGLVEGDVMVLVHRRDGQSTAAPALQRKISLDDRIIVEATASDLQDLLDVSGCVLAQSEKLKAESLTSAEIDVVEAVVMADSMLLHKNARQLELRTHYGINLLGVSRQGSRLFKSPERINLRVGDVVMFQGATDRLDDLLNEFDCLPLAPRSLRLDKGRRLFFGVAIFALAILVATFNILPVQISFLIAAVVMVFTKFINLKEMYQSIDWSVVVLLGAIIPVATALETTQGAKTIADTLLSLSSGQTPWLILLLLMLVTMFLSNIINNAAAVLIMAPIALSMATSLQVSVDPFLMGVAISASAAFMTPIGHQSNTLVMGPGGYKFSDYWKLGLPLSLLVLVIGLSVILWVWPL